MASEIEYAQHAQDSKECCCCGRQFYKRARDSEAQWGGRKYCSLSCRNKSTPPEPIHIRFWRKANRLDEKSCWPWTGSVDGGGYGTLASAYGKAPFKAHRISWEIHNGQLPEGAVVCHLCDNPVCVNPSHLQAADQKENMQKASKRGRLNSISLLNLRPGAKSFHGAGPISNKEKSHGQRGQ